jgi:hypothetical protein
MKISLFNQIINRLVSFGQEPNLIQQYSLKGILKVIEDAILGETSVFSLEPGGGKSTLIEEFLVNNQQEITDFGAVIVVERKEDAKRLRDKINQRLGNDVAYALFGFDENDCLLNINENKKYSYCVSIASNSCIYKRECRYIQKNTIQKDYPIVILNTARLALVNENPEEYMFFFKGEKKIRREYLFIDEKPPLIWVRHINKTDFLEASNEIKHKINFQKHDNSNFDIYSEFSRLSKRIEPLFDGKIGRELIPPIDTKFVLSKNFWKVFTKLYNYQHKYFEIPSILESLIVNGGHKYVTKSKNKMGKFNYKLTSQKIHSYGKWFAHYKTFIFDGTADIDPDYSVLDLKVYSFKSIRTYEKLTFHVGMGVSSSKSSFEDGEKVHAFCKDIKEIAIKNKGRKIFLPVYKDYIAEIKKNLTELIEGGQIRIAHFGSTRGSNQFNDCDIVILGGFLHKGEDYYLQKAIAFHKVKGTDITDIDVSVINKVRKFNDNSIELVKLADMLVDFSQEIKRSSQRDTSQNIKGDVFVFSNDIELLDNLAHKFPNAQFNDWFPEAMIEQGIKKRSNNTLQQILILIIENYLKQGVTEISYQTLKNEMGFENDDNGKKAFSKLMTNRSILEFIYSKGYKVVKEGKYKFLVK